MLTLKRGLVGLLLVVAGSASACTSTEKPRSDAVSDQPTTAPEPPTFAECVVGVWKVDNKMFAKNILAQGQIPGGMDLSVEGDLVLRLGADGTFSHIKDNFTLVMSARGQKTRSVTTGSFVGKYAVEGADLHFFDSADVHHESYLEMPGGMGRVSVATGEDANVRIFDVTAKAPVNSDFGVYDGAATAACGPDRLDITVKGVTTRMLPSALPDMKGWQKKG